MGRARTARIEKTERSQVMIRMPAPLRREIERVASERGATRTTVILDAVRLALELPAPNLFDDPSATDAPSV